MANERMDQQIRLQDGRMLGYAEYGAPDGVPVFYFHGFPSSRLDWQFFDSEGTLTEQNARIIAVDRPGSGLSDFQRGRRILDWPADVAELADAIPNCNARFYEDEGHLTLPHNRMKEILGALVA